MKKRKELKLLRFRFFKEKAERAEVIENAKLDITAKQIDKEGKQTTGDLKEVLDKYFKEVPEEITEQ